MIFREKSGEIIGYSRGSINNFIHDIVTQSKGTDDVRMSDDVELGMRNLRQFMYDKVYSNQVAKCEEKEGGFTGKDAL